MAHGISGLALVSFRAVGAAFYAFGSLPFSADIKKMSLPGLTDVFLCRYAGHRVQPMLLYDRAIPDIPGQRQHRHHHPSHRDHDFGRPVPERTSDQQKVLGIFCGAIGALLLILGNGHAAQNGNGNLTGDLLCLTAQCSFAVYLTIFKN